MSCMQSASAWPTLRSFIYVCNHDLNTNVGDVPVAGTFKLQAVTVLNEVESGSSFFPFSFTHLLSDSVSSADSLRPAAGGGGGEEDYGSSMGERMS